MVSAGLVLWYYLQVLRGPWGGVLGHRPVHAPTVTEAAQGKAWTQAALPLQVGSSPILAQP